MSRVVVRRIAGRWHWYCGFCQPVAAGSRDRFEAVFRRALPDHFERRAQHHQIVDQHRRAYVWPNQATQQDGAAQGGAEPTIEREHP